MSNVFLDVGGHLGQSVAVALSGDFTFDHVHTFEPEPASARHISETFAQAIAQGRLTVHQAALSDCAGTLTLFGDNDKGGASIVAGALDTAKPGLDVACLDVLPFIQSLGPTARVYIKLNCEGGEVAILERLCDLPSVAPVAAIMADFDIVKTGFGYYQKRRTLKRARSKGLPVVLSEHVMVGKTHGARLANWLARYPEIVAPGRSLAARPQLLKRRVRYFIRDVTSALGLSASGYRRR